MNEVTDQELEVLSNRDFLKIKASVMEKAVAYLAEIERELHAKIGETDFPFPKNTFLKAGKISKGEQYRLLPYVILDYPRLFSKKEVFAFRSMIWWGHHYSCTLHLSGPSLQWFGNSLKEKLQTEENVYFCVNSHPWDYHYGEENYLPVQTIDPQKIVHQIEQHGFVKISKFIPVYEWNDYKSFTLESFARFLRYLY